MLDDVRKSLALKLFEVKGRARLLLTTKDFKEELRILYSDHNWIQEDISALFQGFVDCGFLEVSHDNGVFRTYTISENFYEYCRSGVHISDIDSDTQIPISDFASVFGGLFSGLANAMTSVAPSVASIKTKPKKVVKAKKSKPAVKRCARSTVIDLILNKTKGRFFTVEFIKKDGSIRRINSKVKKNATIDANGYIKAHRSTKRPDKTYNLNTNTIRKVEFDNTIYRVRK